MGNVAERHKKVRPQKYTLVLALGWVAALLSLFVYPFITGLIGAAIGVATSKRGLRAGMVLIMASIIFMAMGILFGDVVRSFILRTTGI